eukprot:jgi/Psemu1/65/gm1.65_g
MTHEDFNNQGYQDAFGRPESALWLTLVALALGLILGLTIIFQKWRQYVRKGVTHLCVDDDPDDLDWEEDSEKTSGSNLSSKTTGEV